MHSRRYVAWSLLLGLTFLLAGCGDDDPVTPDNNAPTVLLTSPNGGEAVDPGATLTVRWESADDGAVVGVDISYIADGMTGFTAIASDQAASGSFDWTVPNSTFFGVRVRAVATDDGGLTGEDQSDALFAIVALSPRGYATSSTCAECHPSKVDAVFKSGHPYKLSKVVGGQPPSFPFTDVPSPPTGFTWEQITYVIGGYGWKARFMDENGYIITDGWNGVTAQYNLPRPDLGGGLAAEWVPYHAGDTAPKPYTCGTCHTTGWQTLDENGGVHQDGLEGIRGTWEEPGITCEACHGAGGTHVATQDGNDIDLDRNKELCGSCHFRDTNHGILASGGFIRHHEQFDEMISAKHTALGCITCHEPHVGVRHGNGELGGLKVSCESCHAAQAENNAHLAGFAGAPTCVDCHMGRASKSARKINEHAGDIRTHIFKINPDPVAKDGVGGMFFEEDGVTFAQGYITLDFACYGCHKDDAGVGGANSTQSLTALSAKATDIHGVPKPAVHP